MKSRGKIGKSEKGEGGWEAEPRGLLVDLSWDPAGAAGLRTPSVLPAWLTSALAEHSWESGHCLLSSDGCSCSFFFAQMFLFCFSPFLDCPSAAILPLLFPFLLLFLCCLLPHAVTSLPHISPFAPSLTLPPCHFFPSTQCLVTDALLLFCVLPFT